MQNTAPLIGLVSTCLVLSGCYCERLVVYASLCTPHGPYQRCPWPPLERVEEFREDAYSYQCFYF